MYIGIKYCGGCNSRYDRVKLVNDIKNCFKDYEFNYANGNEPFDLILVINGCHISCASLENLRYAHSNIFSRFIVYVNNLILNTAFGVEKLI